MVRVTVWTVLLILLSSVSQAEDGARLALVIGNQDYAAKVGPLKNPRNDAALIETSLKQLGFGVTVLKDASYKAMDSALKRYVTEVHRAGRNALSFFYYSGHGVANPETQINYLIPVDVSDADDDGVWFESFQQNAIIDLLSKQAPNATHYVVFDACRNELNMATRAHEAKLAQERQRAEEIRDFAEAKRVEEQQRAEIVARTEELRKAQDAVRIAREAAAAAEQERLAAVRAAEEVKERVKTAGLPQSRISEQQLAGNPVTLTRTLQAELKRVGCDPGEVDGRWGAKAISALREFSRSANLSLTTDKPTVEALQAVMKQVDRVCSLVCAIGEVLVGTKCITKSKVEPKGVVASPGVSRPGTAREERTPKSKDPGLCWTSRGGYEGLVSCDSPMATGRRIN